jgi:hypothetical protein
MITLRKSTLILLSFFVLFVAKAEDGVMIVSKTKTLNSGKVSKSEIFLTKNKLRLNNSGSDNSSVMFDANTEVFTFIDNNRKEYYEFDKPTLMALKQQIKMMAKMMQQFSAQMPADQKKKFDRILNPDGQPIIAYSATGKSSKVGKWKTTGYEGKSENVKVMELNIASYNTLKIQESNFNVMKVMMDYFKENLQEVITLLPSGGSFSQLSFDDDSPIMKDGIPVKTVSYKEGKAENENVIESIVKKDVDAGMFKVPTGYKRQEINIQSMGR